MTRTFTAWAGSLSSGVARAGEGGAGGGVTLVTVADAEWAEQLPAGEDPLASDPVFQRQVVGCQLVAASVSRAEDGVARTVGGRSLVVTTQPRLAVNQVPVVATVRAGQDEVNTRVFLGDYIGFNLYNVGYPLTKGFMIISTPSHKLVYVSYMRVML